MTARFILFIACTLIPFLSRSQANQGLAQYYNNLHVLNPAFIGLSDYSEFRAGFRQPWNEISNVRSTNFASFSTVLGKKSPLDYRNQPLRISDPEAFNTLDTKVFSRKHGVGLYISQNEIGPFKENSVRGVYAYHIPLTKKSHLSFGTSLIWH
ncbi:MAG: type IX secretion system membrane protein PorP/SprF, partial [Bacteroidota bacterium]